MFDSIMIIIGLLIIIPIAIAFYYDYKADSKSFIEPLKALAKKIAIVAFIYLAATLIGKIYEHYVLPKNNFGTEYNSERANLKIALLPAEWELSEIEDGYFEKHWQNPNRQEHHFLKVSKFGFLKLESETDYYQNTQVDTKIAWSVYNFEDKEFRYFIEKPSEHIVSVDKSGKFRYNKLIELFEITEKEFKNFNN